MRKLATIEKELKAALIKVYGKKTGTEFCRSYLSRAAYKLEVSKRSWSDLPIFLEKELKFWKYAARTDNSTERRDNQKLVDLILGLDQDPSTAVMRFCEILMKNEQLSLKTSKIFYREILREMIRQKDKTLDHPPF